MSGMSATQTYPQGEPGGPEAAGKRQIFHKRQIIFREGQKVQLAFMVGKGTVSMYRVVNNRKVVVGSVGPGQFLGEISLLTKEPCHYNAEADDYTELIPFDARTLHGLLLQCPNPVQRMFRALLERNKTLEKSVADQPTNNTILAVCQILELLYRAQAAEQAKGGKKEAVALSVMEASRTIRNTLLIPQLEIDLILEGLAKINQVQLSEVKEARYGKNIFGDVEKKKEMLKDRTITISDPANFIAVARNLARDEEKSSKPPFTKDLAFMDLESFAAAVGARPDVIYRKMANQEIPAEFFFFEENNMMSWAAEMGEGFFKKAKRKRLNIEDLECVDDVVMVDDITLQEVFGKLGFRKLAILFASAQEETRLKIQANLSSKIEKIVREESQGMNVSEMELADVEGELIDMIKALKGAKK